MDVAKTLEWLDEIHEGAQENVTFWTHKGNDYHVFQSPQRLMDKAAQAKEKAEARVAALTNAIAIIKAAKEYVEAKTAWVEAEKTRFSQTVAFMEAGRTLSAKEDALHSLLTPTTSIDPDHT